MIKADLHVHPYIHDLDSLIKTLKILRNKQLNLFAVTNHGIKTNKQFDFRELISCFNSNKSVLNKLDIKFNIQKDNILYEYKDSKGYLIPAYELKTRLLGKEKYNHILVLHPDLGFEELEEKHPSYIHNFEVLKTRAKHYNSIFALAHGYVLEIKLAFMNHHFYRIANFNERKKLRNKFNSFFIFDNTSTTALYLRTANLLLNKDFKKIKNLKPIANSDAHGYSDFLRQDIGLSYTIFNPEFDYYDNFKDKLKQMIKNQDYETHFKGYNLYHAMRIFIGK